MPVEGRGLTSGMLWKGPRIRRVAMLPRTSIHDSAVPEGTRGSAKDGQACRFVGRPRKPVGEPDAANQHVRFDEGEVETEAWEDTRAPPTERAGHTQGFPTLPRHLSTLPEFRPNSDEECPRIPYKITRHVRAPCQGVVLQWVQLPPGNCCSSQ